MPASNDYTLLCESIKHVLKQKKLSYRDVAHQIGMSESGFKKLMSGKDASFTRLIKICEAIGVSLADLINGQEQDGFRDVTFSDEQQRYFLANMSAFHFFWALVYERDSISQIEDRLGLDAKKTSRYLRDLDRLGLIKIGIKGKIQLPKLDRIRWRGTGPLIEKIYREWALTIVRDLARPHETLSQDELFVIRYFKLQEKSYDEFLRAHRELEQEFVKRAIREMKLGLPKMRKVRWVTAIDDNSFLENVQSTALKLPSE